MPRRGPARKTDNTRPRTKAQQRQDERERNVATIRTIWASLDSHLDVSTRELSVKERGTFGGSRKFHADTVREYAEAILALAKNL